MKIILSLFLFLVSFSSAIAATKDPVPDLTSYEGYTYSVENFCAVGQVWAQDWKKNSLITQDRVIYADILNSTAGDETYKKYLQGINADTSRISTLGITPGPAFLEKASYVYKETMGAIYACAVMNARTRIIGNLLVNIPTTQSNLKIRLENQLKSIGKEREKHGCRDIKDTSEFSLKKLLLDNTTYQYCNYRHYLYYLSSASKESLNAYYDRVDEQNNGSTPSVLDNTEAVAQEITRSANKITEEINHTKEIFPQAMAAFTEFEKTYASHIILQFILQDYVDLRDSLKKTMNPIGQVIYKVSNAQSPK